MMSSVSIDADENPPIGLQGISADSLDRLARVARRGLRASAVMIGGSSIETVVVAGTIASAAQLGTLRSLCMQIEHGGELSVSERPARLGIALRHPDGQILGAICAIDDRPRIWSVDDRALLTDLAALFESEADLSAEIERRRTAEETSELVTRELSHRIKNIFTVIGSLVSLSARAHPEARDFARAVGERIAALGRANDYVRPHGGTSSRPPAQSLLGLIDALMAPYQEAGRARIRLEGEDAPVGRLSVTTLALVLHELATNAVKYGALSLPDGNVTISCAKNGQTLALGWREQGGPEISEPPTQEGFGTLLSERAATAQLGAAIHHHWLAEGLVLRLEIPLQRLAT